MTTTIRGCSPETTPITQQSLENKKNSWIKFSYSVLNTNKNVVTWLPCACVFILARVIHILSSFQLYVVEQTHRTAELLIFSGDNKQRTNFDTETIFGEQNQSKAKDDSIVSVKALKYFKVDEISSYFRNVLVIFSILTLFVLWIHGAESEHRTEFEEFNNNGSHWMNCTIDGKTRYDEDCFNWIQNFLTWIGLGLFLAIFLFCGCLWYCLCTICRICCCNDTPRQTLYSTYVYPTTYTQIP